MKVVHFAAFVPHGTGQFATVIDLIKAERSQGIDAQFVDCGFKDAASCRVGLSYAGVTSVDPKEAFDADVLIRHSIIPPEIENLRIPSVMAMHGRPENSFLLEYQKKNPVYSIIYERRMHPNYKAYVTFWKEFQFNWRIFVPENQVYWVPAMIDLDHFSPDGDKFNFGVKGGSPNIICADVWREDVTPYNVIHGAVKFIKEYCPSGKLHLFGLSHEVPILEHYTKWLNKMGILGFAWSKIDFLPMVYRSADILVTPHTIATRVIRESLSCGLSVVGGGGCPYTAYGADPRNTDAYAFEIDRCWRDIQCSGKDVIVKRNRKIAEKEFNLERAGKEMKKLLDSLVAGKNMRLIA